MASVASAGTTDRTTARILFKVVRAGSGTRARYSSTVFGAALPFAAGPRSRECAFFILVLSQGGSAPVNREIGALPPGGTDRKTLVCSGRIDLQPGSW